MIPPDKLLKIITDMVDDCGGDEELAVEILAERARTDAELLMSIMFAEKYEIEVLH